MNEIMKVALAVIGAGVGACLLVAAGQFVGKFLRANAAVQTKPTPEVAKDYWATDTTGDWSIPVLTDVRNPEHYPKTWAYRAKRGGEATTEIRMEP